MKRNIESQILNGGMPLEREREKAVGRRARPLDTMAMAMPYLGVVKRLVN
jgi:hypothetical protein